MFNERDLLTRQRVEERRSNGLRGASGLAHPRARGGRESRGLSKFLLWAIASDETNEKYLRDAHFIALPAHMWG